MPLPWLFCDLWVVALSEQLPLEINPFALADQGAKLKGELAIAGLKHLTETLDSTKGVVQVQFTFGREKHGPRYIKGLLSTTLRFVCQRCGEPASYDINVKLCLSPVISDSQAAKLPKEYEALVTQGEPVLLADIIEEELLLSMPMFPKHRLGGCPIDISKEY